MTTAPMLGDLLRDAIDQAVQSAVEAHEQRIRDLEATISRLAEALGGAEKGYAAPEKVRPMFSMNEGMRSARPIPDAQHMTAEKDSGTGSV